MPNIAVDSAPIEHRTQPPSVNWSPPQKKSDEKIPVPRSNCSAWSDYAFDQGDCLFLKLGRKLLHS
jgi:hypothetical protein